MLCGWPPNTPEYFDWMLRYDDSASDSLFCDDTCTWKRPPLEARGAHGVAHRPLDADDVGEQRLACACGEPAGGFAAAHGVGEQDGGGEEVVERGGSCVDKRGVRHQHHRGAVLLRQ